LSFAAAPAPGEQADDARTIEALIDGLVELVRDNYLLPERVEAIEARLRNGLEGGDYRSYSDFPRLCERLTSDLRESSGDQHFGIRPTPVAGTTVAPREGGRERDVGPKAAAPSPPTGLGKIEVLSGNVGYLEVEGFVAPSVGSAAVDDAFRRFAGAAALVVDLRGSQGGQPGMVAYLLSYFFDREPFLFNRLEWPGRGETMEFETVGDLPAPRFANRDVFILTSAHTPSAAEGFSYHMKHLGRATIVGERTAGAAHLSQMFELPGFQVAIPTGRPISPITGGNWEGVGVVPHHEVPAAEALDLALALAVDDGDGDPAHNGSR
jgi:C-terminal processing protease CtpA/Prc